MRDRYRPVRGQASWPVPDGVRESCNGTDFFRPYAICYTPDILT